MSNNSVDYEAFSKSDKKLKVEGKADGAKPITYIAKSNTNNEQNNRTESIEKQFEEEKKCEKFQGDNEERPLLKGVQVTEAALDSHYGKGNIIKQGDRQKLDTSDLRNLHNWIKAVLIRKYENKVKDYYWDNYRRNLRMSVLDLGCGNGGDLSKWIHARIGYYVGVDVVKEAVENAYDRWRNIRGNKFKADFITVGGAVRESKFFKNIDRNAYFDIVSSQFVIHYMFSKESYVERLFKNISKALVEDGYFICTIPNADVLLRRILTQGNKTENGDIIIGNEHYSIRIKEEELKKTGPYGIKYGFFLADSAVGNKELDENGNEKITYIPEYIIDPENLRKVAKKYDLELVEERNFRDFSKDALEDKFNTDLLSKLRIGDIDKIDPKLWAISELYKVVVFRKIRGRNMNKVDRHFEDYAQGKVIYQNDRAEDDDMAEEQAQSLSYHKKN